MTMDIAAFFHTAQTDELIESLLRYPQLLLPDETCEQAYRYFQKESEECIVVCEEGQIPVGLIMKNLFFRQMGSVFGQALYFRRSVTWVMDQRPLILDIATSVEEMIELALNREDQFLYDCIIVTENGKLKGVLTFSDLLTISSTLQRQATNMHLSSIGSTEKLMTNINSAIRKVDHSITSGLTLSEEMVNQTLDGKNAMQAIIGTFERLNDNVERIEQHMKELEQQSLSIRKFVDFIQEIAEQTNILSLNASIEAARAKEQGKGFAVIADEVRKLAADTKAYSEQVHKITEQIAGEVMQAAATAKSGKDEAAESMIHVQNASVVFEQLFAQISKTTQNMNEIHALSQTANKEGELARLELQSLTKELESFDSLRRS